MDDKKKMRLGIDKVTKWRYTRTDNQRTWRCLSLRRRLKVKLAQCEQSFARRLASASTGKEEEGRTLNER